MRRLFYLSLIFTLRLGCLFADDSALPVWFIRNWENADSDAPLNFRSMQDEFHREKGTALLPTRLGLFFLRASGSAQFSEKNIQWIKNKLMAYRLTVVDLRQEPHGFLNGLPISWYMGENEINRGKGLAEIISDEQSRLNGLSGKTNLWVFKLAAGEGPDEFNRGIDPELTKVNDVISEERLCADLEFYYLRLPVADYQRPSDKEVDQFIRLVRFMNKDSWLHIHCAEGDGRTTTFLAMFDMLHNAKYVRLEDIVKRQWLLGGVDLLYPTVAQEWKPAYAWERADFIRHFYQYCQTNNDDFNQPWSEWVKKMEGANEE